MHRSEEYQTYPCIACGEETSTQERAFAVGDDDVICFRCAVARNGVYDEGHDHWVVVPYFADLFTSAHQN
jgi:hypothetical protein